LPDKERITSLVCAAQAGDDLSFAELARNYQEMAVAYATSILRDYYLAEDADADRHVVLLYYMGERSTAAGA
jgi:hypothetical protein